jgi:hypothetical protein
MEVFSGEIWRERCSKADSGEIESKRVVVLALAYPLLGD